MLDTATGTNLTPTVKNPKRPGPRKIIATPEELGKLFNAAEPWLRLWLMLCSQLALRNAEARHVGPAEYNHAEQTITYRKKGGQHHQLPVTPEIAAMFEAAPEPPPGCNAWSFVERWRGRPLGKGPIESAWVALKKRAGVRAELRAHDIRRTTAVSLYTLTRDIRTVSHLLGHENLVATCQYLAYADPKELRPLLAQMRPITETKQ
jgi:integrase